MIIRIRISSEAKITLAKELNERDINMASMILNPDDMHDKFIRNINKKIKITKYGYNKWRLKKIGLKITNYLIKKVREKLNKFSERVIQKRCT